MKIFEKFDVNPPKFSKTNGIENSVSFVSMRCMLQNAEKSWIWDACCRMLNSLEFEMHAAECWIVLNLRCMLQMLKSLEYEMHAAECWKVVNMRCMLQNAEKSWIWDACCRMLKNEMNEQNTEKSWIWDACCRMLNCFEYEMHAAECWIVLNMRCMLQNAEKSWIWDAAAECWIILNMRCMLQNAELSWIKQEIIPGGKNTVYVGAKKIFFFTFSVSKLKTLKKLLIQDNK